MGPIMKSSPLVPTVQSVTIGLYVYVCGLDLKVDNVWSVLKGDYL